MIRDTALLPSSGCFYGDGRTGSDVLLPDYEKVLDNITFSPRSGPLTLTGCHDAICSALRKARLITFEVARRQRSFSAFRGSRDVALQGEAQAFDQNLSSTSKLMEQWLDVKWITFPDDKEYGDPATGEVLERLIVADSRFQEANGKFPLFGSRRLGWPAHVIARLKRALLRLEKSFVDVVIEPLKRALINGAIPDFEALLLQGRRHGQGIQAAAYAREGEARTVATAVQGT